MANRLPAGEGDWETVPETSSDSDWVNADQGFEDGSVFIDPNLDFPGSGRTRAKMFGTDPQSQINFLKKVNPGIDFTTGKGGEILFTDPASGKLGYLDKPFMQSITDPSELLEDVKDVGYDIPAGIAQTVATGMGAMYGGIPGAMAASSGTSALLEAGRQGLGNLLGMDQEYDPTSVAIAAGTGALVPPIFGTGITQNQAAKRAAGILASKGVSAAKPELEAATQKVIESQKGMVSKGFDFAKNKVLPKIGSKLTGENERVIQWAAENLDKVKQMEEFPEKFAYKMEEGAAKVNQALKQKEQEYFKRMDQVHRVLDKEGVSVDIQKASEPIQELKQKLTDRVAKFNNPEDISQLELVEDMEKQYLLSQQPTLRIDPRTGNIDLVDSYVYQNRPASDAFELTKTLNDVASKKGMDFKRIGRVSGPQRDSTTTISGDVAAAFGKTAQNIKKGLEDSADQFFINRGNDPSFTSLKNLYVDSKQGYGAVQNIQKELDTKLKDAGSINNFLKKVQTDIELAGSVKKLKDETGIDLVDQAIERKAFKLFAKPSDKRVSYQPELDSGFGTGRDRWKTRALYGAGLALPSVVSGGLTVPGQAMMISAGLAELGLHPWSYRKGMGALQNLSNISASPAFSGTGQFLQRQSVPRWSLMNTEEEKK